MKTDQFALTITDGTGTFYFAGHPIRFILKENEPWFVAVDCGTALGILKARKAVEAFPDDERDTAPIKGGVDGRPRETIVISLPGLLRMIFQSRKSEAEAFKRYVYHEVLPAIQKTGKFEVAPALPAPAPSDEAIIPQARAMTMGDLAEIRKQDAEQTKRKLDDLRDQLYKHENAANSLKNEISMVQKEYDAHRTLFLAALRPMMGQAIANVPPVRTPDRDEIILREALRLAYQEPLY